MGHTRPVAKRQLGDPANVDRTQTSAEKKALAAEVGARIRAIMRAKGWVRDDGEPDVARLQRAVGSRRFQTVQFWVEGQAAPRMPYARKLAQVFGVTLEEIMGLSERPEPPASWAEWKTGPHLGSTATQQEERLILQTVAAWGRNPTASGLDQLLLALRQIER